MRTTWWEQGEKSRARLCEEAQASGAAPRRPAQQASKQPANSGMRERSSTRSSKRLRRSCDVRLARLLGLLLRLPRRAFLVRLALALPLLLLDLPIDLDLLDQLDLAGTLRDRDRLGRLRRGGGGGGLSRDLLRLGREALALDRVVDVGRLPLRRGLLVDATVLVELAVPAKEGGEKKMRKSVCCHLTRCKVTYFCKRFLFWATGPKPHFRG